jgi:hypothetical protein
VIEKEIVGIQPYTDFVAYTRTLNSSKTKQNSKWTPDEINRVPQNIKKEQAKEWYGKETNVYLLRGR